MSLKYREKWTHNLVRELGSTLIVAEFWHLDYFMRSYQEFLHVFCSQFGAYEKCPKITLQRWKWQREIENPLGGCIQKNNASDFTVKSPRDPENGSISTMQVFALLTTLYSTQWRYFYACFDKPCRDTKIWRQRDGNFCGRQGLTPMNVPQARLTRSQKKTPCKQKN